MCWRAPNGTYQSNKHTIMPASDQPNVNKRMTEGSGVSSLRFENTYIDLPILTKTSQLAITALQAYQPKNFVICENGDDEFVCFEDDGERIKKKPNES